jgi:hypothetical protein
MKVRNSESKYRWSGQKDIVKWEDGIREGEVIGEDVGGLVVGR